MAENKNSESEYTLHGWDLKLIQAAIGLGDTLMRLPEVAQLITIGSVYCAVPDRDDMADFAREDWFMFEPGWSRECGPEDRLRWADRVSDPSDWRKPDQDFEIETEFEVGK
jgi:hypothetical protein